MDTKSGKRTSLHTGGAAEARQIIEAKNNSERQPLLNLQVTKAYLAGTDNGITTRTLLPPKSLSKPKASSF